ncbi:adenine phosphoribosyltransferase [Proteinivorax hydrogeniformans]|uniref:Adenine phosphoribosyltransferase n=1 Tax=Proteinivorax hydrogeniformans TaxID=1826727 RepID=A0AAU8HRG9_9FIRM
MDLKSKIRVIEDFPHEGISFKDITTLMQDGVAFKEAIKQMAEPFYGQQVDVVVGPEARGFLIGTPLAYELTSGFVPVRKSGKLPYEVVEANYELEYGNDTLQIHKDAIKPGDKVIVADDLLATGGTVKSTVDLVKELGGEVIGVTFLIELTYLNGRDKLKGYDIKSLITY